MGRPIGQATPTVEELEQEIAELKAANKKLVDGPYVVVNSPQMVKDMIDAEAITDGMAVIIQSTLPKEDDDG